MKSPFIGSITSLDDAFNRTIQELKYRFNNKKGGRYFAFNRTIQELKLVWVIRCPGGYETFNRTIQELK